MPKKKGSKTRRIISKGDPDPEDADFAADGTAAKRKQKNSLNLEKLDDSRAHYGGERREGLGLGRARGMMALPIDDESFMGGKYAGQKTSRAELGYQLDDDNDDGDIDSDKDEEEQEYDGSQNDPTGEEPSNPIGLGIDETTRQELRRLAQTDKYDIELVARRQMEDVERGKRVRMQLDMWQRVLDWRVRLQPLLNMANRLPSATLLRISTEEGDRKATRQSIEQLAKPMVAAVSPTTHKEVGLEEMLRELDSSMAPIWRASLEKWHQRATLVSSEGHIAKKQLKVINQPPWTQVEIALRDRERLLARTRIRRSAEPLLVPEDEAEFFDDGDLFQQLAREWIDSLTGPTSPMADSTLAMTAAGLLIRPAKIAKAHLANGRANRGRKLRYDIHDKLVNYMPPVPPGTEFWPDDKIDAFFSTIFYKHTEQTS